MRRCELCKAKAWMHCASDKASLCWDCDAAVHSANFLVARHSRILFCRVCQTPTAWCASGGKLRPTVSFCEQCVDQEQCNDSGEEKSEDAAEEDVVEDDQIIPRSPPPGDSSSSDDESDSGDVVVSRKRFRIERGHACAAYGLNIRTPPPYAAADATETLTSSKTAHRQQIQIMNSGGVEVRGSGILDSLRRLHQEDTSSDPETVEYCCSYEPSILFP